MPDIHLHFELTHKNFDLDFVEDSNGQYLIDGTRFTVSGDREQVMFLESIPDLTAPLGISGNILNLKLQEMGATGVSVLKTHGLAMQALHIENPIFSKIKSMLDHLFPENMPGANVLIYQKDKMLFSYSSGLSRVSPPEKSSIFLPQHFASISKQFTAACICNLESENKISFDDDIRKYLTSLPKFQFLNKESELTDTTITVDDLLTMKSALPHANVLFDIKGISDDDTSQDGFMAMLEGSDSFVLSERPESSYYYNNGNYWLLAKIVEKVSGIDLAEYAEEHFFRPLNMNNTHLTYLDQPVEDQTIPGYMIDNDHTKSITTHNLSWGPTGVIAPPVDMIGWQNCPSDIWEKLTQLPVGKKEGYARGLIVINEKDCRLSFHSGAISGFQTKFMRMDHPDPEKSVSIFVSTNTDLGSEENRSIGKSSRLDDLVDQFIVSWSEDHGVNIDVYKGNLEKNSILPETEIQKLDIGKVVKTEELRPYEGRYYCSQLKKFYSLSLAKTEIEGSFISCLELEIEPPATEKIGLLLSPDEKNTQIFHDSLNKTSISLRFSDDNQTFIFKDPDVRIERLVFEKAVE